VQADLHERISRAVEQGVAARSAFYASIDLPDEQHLGAPATEAQIAQFEQRIKLRLPPSYRSFLSQFNGWRMVDGVTDLLSLEEMMGGPRADAIRKWQEAAAKWDDETGANGLIIGFSDVSQSRIILDPFDVQTDGEWALIENYKDEDQRYASFIEWLEHSVSDYRAIAADPDGAVDPDGNANE